MQRGLAWLLALGLLASSSVIAPPPVRIALAQVTRGATLLALAAQVEVASATGAFSEVPVSTSRTVLAGDQVRTGPDGVALLTFFDGSETQLTGDALVQLDAAAPGSLISLFQLTGTSVSHVQTQSSTGGFQTDSPPAAAFVRGTTYVATTKPVTPGATACARPDTTTCVTSAILLTDTTDGHVGQIDLIGRVGGTVELRQACDVGAAASQTTLGTLDPTLCAELQQTVTDLRDVNAAARTRQIGEQTNADATAGAMQGGGGGGGGGGAPGGSGTPGGSSGPAQIVATNSSTTRFGVDEGYRNPTAMADIGANWQRVVLAWRSVQPNGPGDFSNLGKTLPEGEVKAELGRGVKLSGLLQFTPAWAATNPDAGERSPPKNLDLPIDDPNNYWARYVYETVKFYSGQIDEWIVWNEPEFRPGDPGAGGSYTWLGSDEQFARLLKVAYLSAKRANPNAVVVFPGTSYWVEQNIPRTQFYERVMDTLRRDPDAAKNHFYHDVLALNLYRNPDDILRVYRVFKGIQSKFGLDLPVWLTETNAMPTDDKALAPCDHASDFLPTTMEQQAAYAVQAFVMAASAGYARAGFYQLTDDNACIQPAVWGAVRDDGSRRPVADALKTAIGRLSGFSQVRFAPIVREEQKWPVWPDDPASYWPNWSVYQAVFDFPGARRVTVVWNADAAGSCLGIAKNAGAAQVVDKRGAASPAIEENGLWALRAAGAAAHFVDDPDGYYFIGGDPLLLIEEGVPEGAPIAPPRVGCV